MSKAPYVEKVGRQGDYSRYNRDERAETHECILGTQTDVFQWRLASRVPDLDSRLLKTEGNEKTTRSTPTSNRSSATPESAPASKATRAPAWPPSERRLA